MGRFKELATAAMGALRGSKSKSESWRGLQLPIIGVSCPEEIARARVPWDSKRFTVTRKITTSQTGDVFEARDSASGLLVALKRVRRLVIRERKALEIERAVRILTTISHPNILPLFGVFADTTSLYLVMDLCQPADDLLERVGSDSSTAVSKVIAPLASALAHIHDKSILHRDVSLANLMQRSTGEICLAGWQQCIHVKRERPVTAPLPSTTPAYQNGPATHAAPESFLEITPGFSSLSALERREDVPASLRRPLTPAADVWSFGILVCELLTSGAPFAVASHGREGPGVHPLVPSGIRIPASLGRLERDLAEGCLQLGPAERISMADVLEHPLTCKYVLGTQRNVLVSLVTASPKPAAAHHAGTITVHKDAGSLPALSPHPGQAADADGHALAPVSSVITGTLLQAVLQGSYHYAPEENRHLASPTGLTVRREALDAAPGHRQQADSPQDSPSALDSGPSRYPNLPRHPPRPCDESPVQRRVSGESTGSVGSPRREWRDATAACSPGRGMCGAGAMPPLPRDAKRRHSLACAWEAELSASAPAAAHLPLSHEPPLHLMAALRTNTLAHHSSPAARRRSTEVGGSCRLTESGSPQTASDFSAHPPLSPTACLTAAKGFSFVPGARHGLRRVAPLDRPSPRGPGMPQSSLGRRRSLEGSSVALATDSIATQYNGAIRIRAANLPALA